MQRRLTQVIHRVHLEGGQISFKHIQTFCCLQTPTLLKVSNVSFSFRLVLADLGFMFDQHLNDVIVGFLRRQVERSEQAEGDRDIGSETGSQSRKQSQSDVSRLTPSSSR